MEDNRIVDLYWARSEDAITETSEKYGKYCYSIAYNILSNAEDADESVNDTYLDAWHNMPPHRPSILSTFLGGGGVPQISVAAAKLCWHLMNWRTVFRPTIA